MALLQLSHCHITIQFGIVLQESFHTQGLIAQVSYIASYILYIVRTTSWWGNMIFNLVMLLQYSWKAW